VLTNNADNATAALCQIAQSGRIDRSDACADLPIGDASTWPDRPDPAAGAADASLDAGGDPGKQRERLQLAMTDGAGVRRDRASLAAAATEVASVAATVAAGPADRAHGEVANLAAVAWALLRAADARTETRGAHARRDHPATDPAWRRRLVHRHPAPAA